jgi:hypothetical protein
MISRKFNKKTMHDEFINKYIIVKDDKTITLIPLPQKKNIIVTLNWKGKVRPEKENSSEEHGERRKSDSVTNELKLNPGESGGKIRREKKVSETNVKNIKKQPFFFLCKRGWD